MSWFSGIIAGILNLLAKGVSLLLNATVAAHSQLTSTVMGNVILASFFPHGVPGWGAGSFADLMSPTAVKNLTIFSVAFWSLGWTFFLISIYLLVMQVAGAHESAIQRDRLKKGLTSLVVGAILIWAGPRFAVLITQFSFYLSDYFLNLGPPLAQVNTTATGSQQLLGSVINLLQALLSIIVWIVYKFREVFLYAWMLFFPLAMAFYTNEKTKGIAKMWWTEWIYQMAIPFGQSVVFGVAKAVASPSNGAALTADDVFVAIAGTVGLLASAVYMRKLVDVVAQAFGASAIGSGHGMAWGNAAMIGGAALAGDVAGHLGVKATSATAGKALGGLFHAADNSKWMRGKAEQAVRKHAEVHAGSIQSGASMDDILMSQKLGSYGDALQSGGVGLEAAGGRRGAASGAAGMIGGTGGGARARGGFGSRGGAHPMTPLIRSRTAGEVGAMVQNTKSALRHSNLGTWVGTRMKGFQNQGGIMGKIGDQVASGAMLAAGDLKAAFGERAGSWMSVPLTSGAQRYMTHRENTTQRLEALRSHLGEVMENNELGSRLPGISDQYDPEHNTFQGLLTPAEQNYRSASNRFLNELPASGMSEPQAKETLKTAETQWSRGQSLPGLHQLQPTAQQAYREAFTAFRPAQLDGKAKDAVVARKITLTPHRDIHKKQVAGSHAFLNDARNAIMNRR